MGKSYLDNLVVLEHSKISSMTEVISVKAALRKYGQEPHNLSINTKNKTWSYGSDGPKSLWVPGRFTKNVGDGEESIYNEGVAGVYDKTNIRHLNAMIYTCGEIKKEAGRRTINIDR